MLLVPGPPTPHTCTGAGLEGILPHLGLHPSVALRTTDSLEDNESGGR